MHILIYLFDGVTALDAIGPYEALARMPDNQVAFVGKRKGLVRTGDTFLGLNADLDIQDVTATDVLIVPGGDRKGLSAAIQDDGLARWIRTIDAASTWTCSVCTGALILGSAGLLNGRKASTNWRARDYLPRFGASYTGQRVTVDGKYMTSAGVSAGIDMGLQLCGKIGGALMAEAVQLSLEYDPEPPFGTRNFRDASPELLDLVENGLRH